MLYLTSLGGLSLLNGPVASTGAGVQRKPLALLALLAASEPQGLSRETVLALLWPERDEEHARSALRQTLHALRRDLTAPDLFTAAGDLRLNPEMIASDVAEFARAVAANDLPTAARLYRGPFLDGFHLPGSSEFEGWASRQRRRLAEQARDAFEALATLAAGQGHHRDAGRWWRQAATVEPTNARVALGLMGSLAAAGDRAGALQHARIYDALVREELGAAPDPEVASLAHGLSQPAPDPRVSGGAMPHPAPRLEATREPDAATATTAAPAAAPPRRVTRSRWHLPAAVGLASAAALVFLIGPQTQDHLSLRLDPARLAVAPFQIFDPALELWREGLVDVLSRDLDGAGRLRTVAPSLVIRSWSGRPDPESASRLGRLTGAGTVLFGTLLSAGPDSVRIIATLVDARSGRVLAEVGRRDAADRIDRLTDSLTLTVVRELDAHAGDAALRPGLRSASLEALKLFLQGERHYRATRWDSARLHYEHALERDSGLVLAYRRLGHVYGWERVNFDSVASVFLLRAGALNQGLGPRDSLLVRSDSLTAAINGTDDPLASWTLVRELFHTIERATTQYPNDPEGWFAAGEAGYHFGTGPSVTVTGSEVLAAFDQAIALDSGFAPAYLHPVELALTTDGPESALRYAQGYLALDPVDVSHRGVRLVAHLLEDPRRQAAELGPLLDTTPAHVLSSARTTLRHWPDSAETALLLGRRLAEGRPSPYPLFADTAFMRRRLAEQLAFRGYLREAYEVLGVRQAGIFADLAILGAVPVDTARAVFEAWLRDGSSLVRLIHSWWAAEGDSASLSRSLEAARERAVAGSVQDRFRASYDTAAARAYLALVRADSAEALRRFTALPDSACVRCYVDRLTRARLLSAAGRDEEAFAALEERLVPYLTPFEVVFARERARVADRLGHREAARAERAFVQRAWGNVTRATGGN